MLFSCIGSITFRPCSAGEIRPVLECKFPAHLKTPENTPRSFGRPGLLGLAREKPVEPRRVGRDRRREYPLAFLPCLELSRRGSSPPSSLVTSALRRRSSPPPYAVAHRLRRRASLLLPRDQGLPHLLEPSSLTPSTGSLIPPPPELLTPPQLSFSVGLFREFYQVRLPLLLLI